MLGEVGGHCELEGGKGTRIDLSDLSDTELSDRILNLPDTELSDTKLIRY
jgi:hypothetical protein